MSATLEVRDLGVSRGERLVVHGVSFEARHGEVVALMGASGTGKTTVLRAIGGLEPLTAGMVTIEGLGLSPGTLLHGERQRQLSRRVGVVFQFHHLFGHLNALQNVTLAPVHVLKQPRHEAEVRARELLQMLGVGHRATAMPEELSGGEAQRVAIARALAVDPPVLLMDEPTASLDRMRRDELAALVRDLVGRRRTILVATHDAAFARACADRVVLLADGQVARQGPPADVLA